MAEKKVTVHQVLEAKAGGRRLVMVTAYDYPSAVFADAAGVDMILVGDSLGNAVLGYGTTLPVTMRDMLHHTAAAARGVSRALLIADMPFLSYQVSMEEGRRNAGRFLKEAGAEAVKVEGGERTAPLVASLVEMGIPVMGHVGLTPQSVHAFGGYRLQGAGQQAAESVAAGARALQDAGAFAVVLEKIPSQLGARITAELSIPTIGIGAGPACDGQVLVLNDIIGLSRGPRPKFVKVYDDLGVRMESAVREFAREVREGTFPDDGHSYS